MNWYYASGAEQKGPVSEQELQGLIQQGAVNAQTLVWREGMANWEPYGNTAAAPVVTAVAEPPADSSVRCANCGGSFAQTDVIPLAGALYCATCKPIAVQRLREGVSSNSDAEAVRRQYLNHEASVRSVGFLYYLGGAAMLVMSGVGIIGALGASGMIGAMELAMLFLILLLGIGQIVVGTGLRRLRKWARIPTAILSGIGLLGFPIGTIINAYILYLVLSKKGGMVFSDEYRAVMEQTPHIKYRTSIVIWILLALVLVFLAVAIGVAILGRR